MKCFVKYFFLAVLIQILFAGFVFLSTYIFGSAIGDGILFFLYALPWLVIFAGKPESIQIVSGLYLAIGFLIPAVIYSSVISAGICLVARRGYRNE